MRLPQILPLLLSIVSFAAVAQQDPVYASEGQRSFWFNPASIGTYNAYSANSVFRKQWVGVDASPLNLEFNGAIKFLTIGNTNSPHATGATGLLYRYKTVGNTNSHQVVVPLNFQYRMSNSILSIGVSPGFINREKLDIWIPPTPVPDPEIVPTSAHQSRFTTGAGVQWYGQNFAIGIASTHLFQERFEKVNYQSIRVYYLNGMYTHSFNEKFAINGLAVVRTDSYTTAFQGLINGEFGSANKFTAGLGYRNSRTIIGALTKRYNRLYFGYFIEYSDLILSDGAF